MTPVAPVNNTRFFIMFTLFTDYKDNYFCEKNRFWLWHPKDLYLSSNVIVLNICFDIVVDDKIFCELLIKSNKSINFT
jgi:hypothetical protein